MGALQTVLGTVDAGAMGRTLVHEHLVFGNPGWYADETVAPYDRERCVERATDALSRVADRHGVGTVVDATPNDAGRDPVLLAEVAERTGVNVVCATGLYPEAGGATAYFGNRRGYADVAAEMQELFERELTTGIADTGVRAGVIKVGSSADEITDYDDATLRAAAAAQETTGVPIVTHTQWGTMGPEQAERLVEYGADPARTVVGHIGGATDAEYVRETLDHGVTVAFDQFGMDHYAPDDSTRVDSIVKLVEAGYGDRILVSQDFIVNWLGRSVEPVRDRLPNWSLERIFEDTLPRLREAGVPADRVEALITENPARVFG